MKHYYVNWYRDFANTFNLGYAEAGESVPRDWERITRKKAFEMARNADGFGSDTILPVNYPLYEDIRNDSRYHLVGRIWEKV